MLDSKNRIISSCVDELRTAKSGRVALPGHQLYDEGCRVRTGAVCRRPPMVDFCKQPEDVQAAVLAARRHGLPLSVRGGGHDWAGRAAAAGAHNLVAAMGNCGTAFADPSMPWPPVSVWETTRHPWVSFDHELHHFGRQPELVDGSATARRRAPETVTTGTHSS